jgi:hypothetical protein
MKKETESARARKRERERERERERARARVAGTLQAPGVKGTSSWNTWRFTMRTPLLEGPPATTIQYTPRTDQGLLLAPCLRHSHLNMRAPINLWPENTTASLRKRMRSSGSACDGFMSAHAATTATATVARAHRSPSLAPRTHCHVWRRGSVVPHSHRAMQMQLARDGVNVHSGACHRDTRPLRVTPTRAVARSVQSQYP